MVDFSTTLKGNSERLNADDLMGQTLTITITSLEFSKDTKQPLMIHYQNEAGKPYYPCLSMRRVISQLWGTDGRQFGGRQLRLFRDASVNFGKDKVGGIRISHASHIGKRTNCLITVGKGLKRAYYVDPLPHQDEAPTQKKGNVDTRVNDMLSQITTAPSREALESVTGEEGYIKSLDWLRSNRPALAENIDHAVQEALARFDAQEEEMPA